MGIDVSMPFLFGCLKQAAEKLRLFKNSQIVAPSRQAPRRRSSATPHEGAFEDEGLMAVFQQPARSLSDLGRIYCENGKSARIPGNFRQIGPLFALKFPKIRSRLPVSSLRSPISPTDSPSLTVSEVYNDKSAMQFSVYIIFV